MIPWPVSYKINFDVVEDLHILNILTAAGLAQSVERLTAERVVEEGRGFDSRDRTKVLS